MEFWKMNGAGNDFIICIKREYHCNKRAVWEREL